jgi:hypothetical protein
MDLFRKMNGWVVEVNAQSNGRPVVCYKISADAEAYRGSHGRRASAGLPPASLLLTPLKCLMGILGSDVLPLMADRDCSNSMVRTAGAGCSPAMLGRSASRHSC